MDEPFEGVIGRFTEDSTAWWPPVQRAPEGAPNVVLVVLDDVGFAQLGCYGSRVDTPVLDGLAAKGLQFTGFHTTALCSPTRSCLLTGRNHHANGMGRVAELAAGFPGYDSRIPRANAMLPAVLTGFSSWAVGKWHLAPEEDVHAAGSRARWPLGRGFERFYGFMDGETHQYSPALVRDNGFTEQPLHRGLPPHRGPGRRGGPAGRRPPAGRRREAVLPLPRDRRVSLPAPGAGRVGTAVSRPVRRRLGRGPRGGPRAAEGARAAPRVDGAVAAARVGPAVGVDQAGVPAGVRPADGGVRRLPVAHRPPHRAAARVPARDRRPRQHDGAGDVRQRRLERGRVVRLASTTTGRGTSARRRSRRTSRGSTSSAARRSTTTTPGAGPSRATPRSVAGSARCTKAGWPTR